ncbi:hypothetical protein [Soonwooa sp.]|uniref:hypothetical protein n=1 Tax=Soonwooa sp. TaxID=1938592 RepID=UPI0026083EEB|nr:hypothetical protein [Soonwooa sp.]
MRNLCHKIIKLVTVCILVFVIKLNAQAIKIFVSDAETGKNIPNAKVCLEGFEIPAIIMQYNKKEKYYYVNEIPANYNTVMVYHKKYNEKGFQDGNALPKELKIKLHEPLQNYYDFVFFESINLNKPRYSYYVEDPYKIVIRPKINISYNDFRNYIYQYIKNNNLEIEPINPAYNGETLENMEPYPILYSPCINRYNDRCIESHDKRDDGKINIFPLTTNGSNDQIAGCRDYKTPPEAIVFFFRKKDGKKFKRYNDPIIAEIEKDINLNVTLIIYSKGIMYDEKNNKSPKNYFRYRDQQNSIFNAKLDSSKVYLYNRNLPRKKIRPPRKSDFYVIDEPNNLPTCKESYQLIDKNYQNIFYSNEGIYNKLFNEADEQGVSRLKVFEKIQQEEKKYPKMKIDEMGLGLGIIDKYEYYYNKNTNTKQ